MGSARSWTRDAKPDNLGEVSAITFEIRLFILDLKIELDLRRLQQLYLMPVWLLPPVIWYDILPSSCVRKFLRETGYEVPDPSFTGNNAV